MVAVTLVTTEGSGRVNMPLRQRLEIIADQIGAICDFTKSVSFRLLEATAWLIILYIVGRAIWKGL